MAKSKKKTSSRETILRSKINAAKRKLQEMKEYKAIMAEEGVDPDLDDKERESKIIVQLLRHEKELSALTGEPIQKPRRNKTQSRPRR